MNKFTLITVALLLGGCQVATLESRVYSPTTGKVLSDYKMALITNAYDSKADSVTLTFPDKTTLELHAPTANPNANVVSAVQSVSSVAIRAVVDALKVVGLP